MSITYITAGFPENGNFRLLEHSAKSAGFNFINISRNSTEPVTFFSKMEYVKSFLENSNTRPSDIIIFSDAYDVVVFDAWYTVVSKFIDEDCDIVFNAEKYFWPPISSFNNIGDISRNNICEFFEEKFTGFYPHINAGLYIGYAHAIYSMVEFSINQGKNNKIYDDQALFQFFSYEQHKLAGLKIIPDQNAKIFGTLSEEVHDYGFDGLTLKNHKTNSVPSIIHSNGKKEYVKSLRIIHDIRSIVAPDIRISHIKIDDKYMIYKKNDNNILLNYSSSFAVVLVFDRLNNRAIFSPQNNVMTFTPNKKISLDSTVWREWEQVYFDKNKGYKVSEKNLDINITDYISEFDCDKMKNIKESPVTLESMTNWSDNFILKLLSWSWY